MSESLQNKVSKLLNGPYESGNDKFVPKKGDDVYVDLFFYLPQTMDDYVNAWPMCIGSYRVRGDGKSGLATLLTVHVMDIIESVEVLKINADVAENLIMYHAHQHQYYIETGVDKVHKRKDDYQLGFRPMLATASALSMTGKPEDGVMLSEDAVATVFGLSAVMKSKPRPPDDSNFKFPAVDWVEIEGYSINDETVIRGFDNVTSVRMMVANTNISGSTQPFTPVHVEYSNGRQVNAVNEQDHIGNIIKYIQPSRQDKYLSASDLVYLTMGVDNSYTLKSISESGVMVKVDYWHGEILRVTFYKDDTLYSPFPDIDTDMSRLGIDDVFPDGSKLIKFFKVGSCDTVLRPDAVTVFDNKLKPTVYDTAHHDIIINDVEQGFVKSFTTVATSDGDMKKHDKFKFAVVGDHSDFKYRPETYANLSGSENYHKLLMSTAVIVNQKKTPIVVSAFHVDGLPQFTTNEFQDEKLVRRMHINKFDENLTPIDVDIKFEEIKL